MALVRTSVLFCNVSKFSLGNRITFEVPKDIRPTLRSIRYFKHGRRSLPKNVEETKIDHGFRSPLRPIAFTFAFSSASLATAAIWQYENLRTRTRGLFRRHSQWIESNFYHKKRGKWRDELNKKWNNLSEGQKMFLPICAINVLVFLAWQVPVLQPTMLRYFCSNPTAKAVCWPMILSTFSHSSPLHLLANMFVLHSFIEGTVADLGKEQFLGLYLAAGSISSLTSHLYKTIANTPGLSLGASGAIMAIIAYVCTCYPNTDLSLIFLPMFTFKAHYAIKTMLAVDATGMIMKWRFLDHAAHFGGALTGIAWCYYGQHYVWRNRNVIVNKWEDLRSYFEK